MLKSTSDNITEEKSLVREPKKMRATGDKAAMKYLRAYFFLDFLLTFLSRKKSEPVRLEDKSISNLRNSKSENLFCLRAINKL